MILLNFTMIIFGIQLIPYFLIPIILLFNSKIDIVDINDIFTRYKALMDEYNNATLTNSEDYVSKSVKAKYQL